MPTRLDALRALACGGVADVAPLRALRYDLDRAGGLQAVVAPPYDVIDAARARQRCWRARRTTSSRSTCPQAPDGGDPYAHAARTLADWRAEGVLVADDEPALWALEQDYTGPGRARAARATGCSRA